ncbi:acetyl-CoA C-acyltransferase [Variovorax sp. WS11]|uniref:acetyl-CoA C-acyltransferase family protein n=1 Tax=Variovorax sp. WS11 TaxID=1105204 RepID=UPI000D0DC8D7|nr:acetyl-CoA C-acyltransferase family protein [Variovorax sp. WS11]NDZ17644.1 acetyl-CoA C-acyltransferase family protein [Variovorax sp. WS11]PSL79574.1 acetyl-CoA C-acyltransferase [Variovorax sp. WS11]
MSNRREVFVVSALRTPIGTFGGSLRDVPLADLATLVMKTALERSSVPLDSVGHVALGNVIPTEPRDAYLSRIAAINAGLPEGTPAFNVNRLCGSGLQAVISAAQSIMLGDCEIAIGAGAESMSRGPYLSKAMRWGSRMGDTQMLDYMVGVLHDPFHGIHMGVTGENVADKYGVTREMMDELAAASHQRGARAIADGRFKTQLVPVEISEKKKLVMFDIDEHVKAATTVAVLNSMKAAFKKDGAVTAGNSSGVNDGAAALVLASAQAVKDFGLKPLARLVSYGHAGVDPLIMGIGSVPAARQALARAGLKVADLSLIEANEAFAAQACAVSNELDLDPEKVNPNGSGISLGHPIGATGAIISTKAVHELQRIGGRYALATMCIGGGQGIAAVYERA